MKQQRIPAAVMPSHFIWYNELKMSTFSVASYFPSRRWFVERATM